MNRHQALAAAREILNGPRAEEAKRLTRIAEAMDPNRPPTVILPDDPPETAKRLALKARTNYLPLIVSTFAQVLSVVGYRSEGSDENSPGYLAWQRNRMDARQYGLHDSALRYGAAYATVLPGGVTSPAHGASEQIPVIRAMSPRQMTAVYADTDDEWPLLALHVDGPVVRLYDETDVHFLGIEQQRVSGLGTRPVSDPLSPQSAPLVLGSLEWIESRRHGVTSGGQPVCPAVRYRDSMLLAGEEMFGIVEPLITIQDRLDETVFGGLVAQYAQAFARQYVIGWIPKNQQDRLKHRASNVWTFEDPDVKVGQLSPTDSRPYLDAASAAKRDLAALSQVPAQALGDSDFVNVAADVLTSLEAAKERRADQIGESLGESHEQLLRTCAELMGDEAGAVDWGAEVRWKDATARSIAATMDALGKMVSMLQVPAEAVWERIPGVTDGDLARFREAATSGDTLAQLSRMIDQQATQDLSLDTPPA